MKRCILSAVIGALCMLLALYGIAAIDSGRKREVYEHTDFVSSLPREDCFLCGNGGEYTARTYWGQDNVGIINLNTFELLPVEINRYDSRGQRVFGAVGVILVKGIPGARAQTCPDRAYSHVQITGTKYAVDREKIQSRLCQGCLDTVNGLWFCGSAPAEYAVINFGQRTLRPLLKSYTWFLIGNYGVDCQFKEDGSIDLLIHYCPDRYA